MALDQEAICYDILMIGTSRCLQLAALNKLWTRERAALIADVSIGAGSDGENP
jgi:hypothetical protein